MLQTFFGMDESQLLRDFQSAGQELVAILEPEEREDLQVNMDALQDRWQVATLFIHMLDSGYTAIITDTVLVLLQIIYIFVYGQQCKAES